MATRRFSARALRGGDRGYAAYHAPRYAVALELLERFGLAAGSAVLDVGASRLTGLLREHFGAAVDTLGFGADRQDPEGRHFELDLNRTTSREGWRQDLPAYDVVVLAEVLEHLHAAPEHVLGFLATLLKEGGLLLLQTPNAAALPKRIKLLLGRNPYERIRLDPQNPGHFREYTVRELTAIAGTAGFRVEALRRGFYFDARFAHGPGGEPRPGGRGVGAVKNVLYRCLPGAFAEGITLVLRRAAALPTSSARSSPGSS
jgi:SAM-dependent methyltransferase